MILRHILRAVLKDLVLELFQILIEFIHSIVSI